MRLALVFFISLLLFTKVLSAQGFEVGVNTISDISGTGTALNIVDDSYTGVNLPFTFDLYGQSFDAMNVYQNGVLQLKDSSTAVTSSYCCRGRDLDTLTSSTYDYLLMPLWTDLVNLNSNNKINKGTTNPYVVAHLIKLKIHPNY